jgi:glycosyltransferase involved in cell wall biosynthesis
MRILMVWSENLNKAGAGRTHFVHLSQQLAARGNQVRILAPGYRPRTTEPLGVPVSYLPVGRRSLFAFMLFHLLVLPALPWLILRYRIQAVYNRGLFHSFLAQALCRLCGAVYVLEINGIGDEELRTRGRPLLADLVHRLDDLNFRWASGFVCVARKLREELIRRGAPADRVWAIHNGAAVEMFFPGDAAEARRKLDLPAEVRLIGFVGTLAPWQGLDLLIDACAQLPGDGPPWQVLLVGNGESRDALAAQSARLGLGDRIRFIPGVPHQQVPLYLQAMDLVVIPIHDQRKLRYGFSALKFWESLAVGLPVLVPDACEHGDVLDKWSWPGEFKTGDAADLAAHIQNILSRLPELRARRQEIHQLVSDQHSWAAVARQTEELLLRLAAGKKSKEAT